MDLPIISTEAIERAVRLVKESHAAGSIGVITGPNGSGKSTALKAIQRRYPNLGLPGKAFYLRCAPVRGHTRGLKDLLDGLGRKILHASVASVAYSAKLCLHELRRMEINTVLLDDIDLWAIESMEGLVALRDMAFELNFPLILILAAASNPDGWLAPVSSAKSRTLTVETFTDLNLEQALGVLRSWGDDFESFVLSAENDKSAVKVAKAIHAHTRGNLRRLTFFASLHRLYFPGRPVDDETTKKILPRLAAA